MNLAEQTGPAGAGAGAEAAMMAELGREERVRLALGSVLPHLIDGDTAALAEEPVIRTRALIAALAADLLRDRGDEAEPALAADLARALAARPAVLAHCHALALEGGVAERLSASGLDPVLSPVLETLLAADHDSAQLAMTALAAQSRFTSRQRRLETVAAELPADLMHDALVALADLAGDDRAATLRAGFDEGRSRLSLLGRLTLAAMGQEERLLDPAAAGYALFATALAQRAGVSRDEAILAGAPGQYLRLVLLMRAAGATAEAIRVALALVHPDAQLPEVCYELSGARAAALLAGEGA